MSVTDSTISNNSVAQQGDTRYGGGGIRSDDSSTIENSTISGNSAYVGGGVLNNDGTTNIRSTTITSNTAAANQGAGVASYGDASTFTAVGNSIIAANSTTTDVDLFSGSINSFTSEGYNVIGDGNATGDFNKTGDHRGATDPKLGPLQDNGVPTKTHALLTGSPAINRGSTTLATDQRGVSRPQGAADDVGAFELEMTNTAPGASGQSVTTSEDVAKLITLSATDADSNPLTYKITTSLPSNGKLYKGNSTAAADEITNASLPFTLPSGGNQVTYVPNANYNNTAATADTFTFKANDGTVDSNEATVSVTVSPVDDSPVAVKNTKSVAEDDLATAIDVLANDTDTDGGPKSIASVSSQGERYQKPIAEFIPELPPAPAKLFERCGARL